MGPRNRNSSPSFAFLENLDNLGDIWGSRPILGERDFNSDGAHLPGSPRLSEAPGKVSKITRVSTYYPPMKRSEYRRMNKQTMATWSKL